MNLAEGRTDIDRSLRHFDADGIDLAFVDMGSGDPVLLIHGFGTNAVLSWVESGWADRLVADGRRVVALDNRGHGESEKLYAPRDYGLTAVSEDARRLLDHLGIARADVIGYSMGARVAALLAVAHPARVRSLVIGGMGKSLFVGLPPSTDIAADIEAADVREAASERGRMFRALVDRTEGDRKALAACMRAPREPVDADALSRLPIPMLVAIGERDTIAGSLADVKRYLPLAELFEIPGRSHMGAVLDAEFIARVACFLSERP